MIQGRHNDSAHRHNESDAKLLVGANDFDAIDKMGRLDNNRQTVSTAPGSRDSLKRENSENKSLMQNQEEEKDSRLIDNKPMSVHDMNALRQSQPYFLKSGQEPKGIELQDRFGTVKVNANNQNMVG
jgi:hypothetical protein